MAPERRIAATSPVPPCSQLPYRAAAVCADGFKPSSIDDADPAGAHLDHACSGKCRETSVNGDAGQREFVGKTLLSAGQGNHVASRAARFCKPVR